MDDDVAEQFSNESESAPAHVQNQDSDDFLATESQQRVVSSLANAALGEALNQVEEITLSSETINEPSAKVRSITEAQTVSESHTSYTDGSVHSAQIPNLSDAVFDSESSELTNADPEMDSTHSANSALHQRGQPDMGSDTMTSYNRHATKISTDDPESPRCRSEVFVKMTDSDALKQRRYTIDTFHSDYMNNSLTNALSDELSRNTSCENELKTSSRGSIKAHNSSNESLQSAGLTSDGKTVWQKYPDGYNGSDEREEKDISSDTIEDGVPHAGSPLSNEEIKHYMKRASDSSLSSTSRGSTPIDGRFIDVNKMSPDSKHFARIETEQRDSEISAHVPNDNPRQMHSAQAKKASQPLVFSSHTDPRPTATPLTFKSSSDVDMAKSNSLDKMYDTKMDKDRHGILVSGHAIHKDSKVHFDEEHLSETKLFQEDEDQQNYMIEKYIDEYANIKSPSSKSTSRRSSVSHASNLETISSDSDHEPTKQPGPQVKPVYRHRKKAGHQPNTLAAPKDSSPMSKSSPMFGKPSVERTRDVLQKHIFGSMPHLPAAAVNEIVQHIQPLALEELANMDGFEHFMELPASLSQEIATMITDIIQRAAAQAAEEERAHEEQEYINTHSNAAVSTQDIDLGVSSSHITDRASTTSAVVENINSIPLPSKGAPKRRHTIATTPTHRSDASKSSNCQSVFSTSTCYNSGPSEYVQNTQYYDESHSKENTNEESQISATRSNASRDSSQSHVASHDTSLYQIVKAESRVPNSETAQSRVSSRDSFVSHFIPSDHSVTPPRHSVNTPNRHSNKAQSKSYHATGNSQQTAQIEDDRDVSRRSKSVDIISKSAVAKKESRNPSTHKEKINAPLLQTKTPKQNVKEKDMVKKFENDIINGTLIAKINSMETFVKSYPNNFDAKKAEIPDNPKVTTSRLLSLVHRPACVDQETETKALTKKNIEEAIKRGQLSSPVSAVLYLDASKSMVSRNTSVMTNPSHSDQSDDSVLSISPLRDKAIQPTYEHGYPCSLQFPTHGEDRPAVKTPITTTVTTIKFDSNLVTSKAMNSFASKFNQIPPFEIPEMKTYDYLAKNNVTPPPPYLANRTTDKVEFDRDLTLNKSVMPYYMTSSALQQATTSSLPGSRGVSPNPDSILSTGRRSAMGQDVRHLIVDKEVTDSQLRKLQVENSSLQTENKLLKEKYNRAQTRVQSLESQLLSTQTGAEHMGDDMSAYMRKSREQGESDRRDLEEKILALTREVQTLKAEKAVLARQLANNHTMPHGVASGDDKSTLINSFRTQLNAMAEEVKKVKELNTQAEKDRVSETDRKSEADSKVVRLTELKSMLQQQLDHSGGGVAEKQVKSLEKRLKITEDRLHQERADRSGKLSQVEEKLISGNAQLQVAEKDLKRQLQREKEKNRNIDIKYKDCREENDRLRVMASGNPSLKNLPSHAKWSTLRDSLSSQQLEDDMRHILKKLEQQDGIDPEQHEQIIWLLWQRNQEVSQRLKEIEIPLESLDIDSESIAQGLKQLRADYESSEEKIVHYRQLYEDCKHERDLLQNTLTHEIQQLVHDKHASQARIHNLEDMTSALRAEKDTLHTSLQSTAAPVVKHQHNRAAEAEVESLKSELTTTKANLQQQIRRVQLLEAETESMRIQLRAKESALNEALDEYMRGGRASEGQREVHHHEAAQLKIQIQSLEAEVQLWRDKHVRVTSERQALEDDVNRLRKQVSLATFTPDGRVLDPVTESEKLALETEVKEKDTSIVQLTVSYNEAENALQRSKQEVLEHDQEVEIKNTQMEQLEVQLRQKQRLVQQLETTENQHIVEVAALTQNLEDCNQELTKLQHELKTVTVERQDALGHVEQLQNDVHKRDFQLSSRLHESRLENASAEDMPTIELLGQTEATARLLQTQVDGLKQQNQRVEETARQLIDENASLLSQCRRGQQQLVSERAQLCQLTSEKVEADQRLHITEEEKTYLTREKNKLELALAKQEEHSCHVTEQLQRNASEHVADIPHTYAHLDQAGKQVAIELGTCRRLLEAREREIRLLKDSVDRHKHEVASLKHKTHMLEEEHSTKQREIDRITTQLSTQIKETAFTDESTQSIANERAKLQLEKIQLEKDVHKDKETLQVKTIEMGSLQSKYERAEEKQRETERELHQKETQLATLEAETRHQNKTMTQLETDKSDLKAELMRCQQEMRNITSLNNTLEQRLSLEKSSLSKEKTDRDYLKEELIEASHQIETLKREYDILHNNLEQEKHLVQSLKDKCQEKETEITRLQYEEKSHHTELASLKTQLHETQQLVEAYANEKQAQQQDIERLCHQVSEKEQLVVRLQASGEESVDTVRKESHAERTLLLQEQQRLKDEVQLHRERVEEVKEQLRQKEAQLESYMQTNRSLEGDVKAKYDLENEVSKLESELSETKRTLARLEGDHTRLTEQHRHLQESFDTLKESNAELRTELRETRENMSQETTQLRQDMQDEKLKHELEKTDLQEKINKTSSALKAVEASLTAVQETKDTISVSLKSAERSIDTLKTQVHEESTGRKLAEQRIESLRTQLDDSRLDRNGFDEKSAEYQSKLLRVENELTLEKEKCSQLKHDFNVAELKIANLEIQNQNVMPQLEDAKAENVSLRGQLDTLKQDLVGKNKRLSLEMKQHSENYDKDRRKLVAQAEQLASDLDSAREQIATKNRENLQLQEQILSLEGHLRESARDIKQLKESLSVEEQTRDRLDKRNMELELLMTKLRSKDSDNINYEANRNEVQKMLNELGKKMQDRMDNQKGVDSDTLAKERKKFEELKKRLMSTESQLSQEQAMHIVSKTQLQSVDDENQRLRTQVSSLRRRLASATHNETDRSKSRIEEINEIIAKSQNRARQMLAAGNYNPLDNDQFKGTSTFNPLHLDLSSQSHPMPNSHYWRMTSSPRPHSDLDKSLGSDDVSLGLAK